MPKGVNAGAVPAVENYHGYLFNSATGSPISTTYDPRMTIAGDYIVIGFTINSGTTGWTTSGAQRIGLAFIDKNSGQLEAIYSIGDSADSEDIYNANAAYWITTNPVTNYPVISCYGGTRGTHLIEVTTGGVINRNSWIGAGWSAGADIAVNSAGRICMLYHNSSQICIAEPSTDWTTEYLTAVHDDINVFKGVVADGSDFLIYGYNTASGSYRRGIIERLNGSGTSQDYVVLWDYGGSNDRNEILDVKVDSSGNIYAAIGLYDFSDSTNSSQRLVKLNSSLTVQWATDVVPSENRSMAWMQVALSPDETEVYVMEKNGSNHRIFGVDVATGLTKSVDLEVIDGISGGGSWGSNQTNLLTEQGGGVYMGTVNSDFGGGRNISYLRLTQTNFEALSTETYDGFDFQGTVPYATPVANAMDSNDVITMSFSGSSSPNPQTPTASWSIINETTSITSENLTVL